VQHVGAEPGRAEARGAPPREPVEAQDYGRWGCRVARVVFECESDPVWYPRFVEED